MPSAGRLSQTLGIIFITSEGNLMSPSNCLRTLFVLGVASVASTAYAQAPNPQLTAVAFVEICMKTAPTFAGAPDVAKRYGIGKFTETANGKLGVSGDETLIVQVQEGKECVVDMPPIPTNAFPLLFTSEVGKFIRQALPPSVPFRAKVGDTEFIFNYESRGFHRLLMLKPDA
jgi:hypothetical protein